MLAQANEEVDLNTCCRYFNQ